MNLKLNKLEVGTRSVERVETSACDKLEKKTVSTRSGGKLEGCKSNMYTFSSKTRDVKHPQR